MLGLEILQEIRLLGVDFRAGFIKRCIVFGDFGISRVQHLLCQTGFGAMSHAQNIASMQRFGEQVMPAFWHD